MSCCTTKTKTETKAFLSLEKHFNEVILESKETHYCLTLRDKASKTGYDYIIWLQVMIAYSTTNTCAHDSGEKLKGACESILNWVDLLKKPEADSKPKQLSLFGVPDENELESEPPYPSVVNDISFAKYHRDLEKVRKSNLMKKYSFFELFDCQGSWWLYKDMTEFEKLLPKDNKAMMELVKDAIIKATESNKNSRQNENEWDNSHNYICSGGSLSDIELINRVKQLIQIELIPYHRAFHVSVDNSFRTWEIEDSIQYRYYFDGKKINGCSWVPTSHIPEYDINDKDFILWIRDYLNIESIEAISDEEILKENIRGYFKRVAHFEDESYLESLMETMNNWKEFKLHMKSKISEGDNGGGNNFSLDGFSGNYTISKKGNVLVTQDIKVRKSLNRSLDGLKVDEYRTSRVIVHDVSGDDLYSEAFRLFGKKAIGQTLEFDFAAA